MLCGHLAKDGAAPWVVFSLQEVFHQLLPSMNHCVPPKMWFQQLSLLWLVQWVTAQTRGLLIVIPPTQSALDCSQPCSQNLTRDLPLGSYTLLSHFSNFIEICLFFSVTYRMKSLGALQIWTDLFLWLICLCSCCSASSHVLSDLLKVCTKA